MPVTTKRKKKRMKKRDRGSGRNEECAVLFKEVNVPVEMDANFPMMSK